MLPPAPSAPPSLEGGLASPGVQECQGNQVRLLSGLSKACNCRLTWVRWTQTQPQGKGETAVQETLCWDLMAWANAGCQGLRMSVCVWEKGVNVDT